MAENIMRGADTFIIDPGKLIDSIKKSKDILERLSGLSTHNKQALGILTHRDIFMLMDYRKVFVQGKKSPLSISSPPYYGLRDYEIEGQIDARTRRSSTLNDLQAYSAEYTAFCARTVLCG